MSTRDEDDDFLQGTTYKEPKEILPGDLRVGLFSSGELALTNGTVDGPSNSVSVLWLRTDGSVQRTLFASNTFVRVFSTCD